MQSVYKKGDQFVIEIGDVLTDANNERVYKIKGFRALIFDDNGLDRLEKYDPEAMVLDAYQRAKKDAGTLIAARVSNIIHSDGCYDLENVTRCKDCEYYREAHYEDETEPPYVKTVCRLFKRQIQRESFCSYAKKRVEEV